MTAWVVLFRGVGGPTQLPGRPLRTALERAGFGQVATYINSGNAVLTSPLTRDEVLRRVAEICVRELGFNKDVHVWSRDEWAALVARNPYPEATAAPATLHAAVLSSEPDPARVAVLQALAGDRDGIEVIDRVAYLHTPGGPSRSKLAARFDKGISVANTARNWNTVARLMAMANAAAEADHA